MSAKTRVLFVDDDSMMLRAVVRIFRNQERWELITAQDAESARPHLASVDVVVTDWDPSGAAMVALCRKHGLPVGVVSGRAVGQDDSEAGERERRQLDGAPFISKPFQRSEMVEFLESL